MYKNRIMFSASRTQAPAHCFYGIVGTVINDQVTGLVAIRLRGRNQHGIGYGELQPPCGGSNSAMTV